MKGKRELKEKRKNTGDEGEEGLGKEAGRRKKEIRTIDSNGRKDKEHL